MPKAAMNENSDPARGKDQVGSSRQVLPMEAETKPMGVQEPTDEELRLGVSGFHPRHDLTALLFVENVHRCAFGVSELRFLR